jgi:hypothetical protein
MVLGDWYEQGSVLSVDARGWLLESMPLESINVGWVRREAP